MISIPLAVATSFYNEILGDGRINVENAAEGLHRAIRKLRQDSRTRLRRQEYEDEPAIWASYIYSGA